MPPFLLALTALVVNDQLFATVIGGSFVSVLALMAWIVRTLATLTARVEYMDDRIERLENMNGQTTRRK